MDDVTHDDENEIPGERSPRSPERQSDVFEEADIMREISQLAQEQLVYETVLRSLAKVMRMSLTNYI